MNNDKHVVLEDLLQSIRINDNDAACQMAENIFNIQESDIDSLFRRNKILEDEYESVLKDYERVDDSLTELDEVVIAKTEEITKLTDENIHLLEQVRSLQQISYDKFYYENKVKDLEYAIENFQKVLRVRDTANEEEVCSLVDELDEKNDMINAMIDGFNLKQRINFDTYDAGDYDWSLVVNRINNHTKPEVEEDMKWASTLDSAIDIVVEMCYPIAIVVPNVTNSRGTIAYCEADFLYVAAQLLLQSTDGRIGIKEYNLFGPPDCNIDFYQLMRDTEAGVGFDKNYNVLVRIAEMKQELDELRKQIEQ